VVDLRHDPVTSNHFLAKPSSLAFGAPGVLGTIHDEHERTQGPFGTPPDFMGPTLWSADPSIFDAGDPSHLDMLHNSPDGVGIAWAGDHVYWVFDGTHGSLTRYDFGQPHELGGTYHGDGIIQRWVEGEVARGPDSVGHLAYDDATGFLYVADTGHARLARLDTASGQEGRLYGPAYDTPDQYKWDDAVLDTLVDGSAIGLEAPAGLELSGGLLWVTDAATATIWAFDLSGNAVDWLPTGRTAGALQGLTLDANGDLWVVDARAGELLHVAPR
jgi:sugar lactone lactonase YvrE